MAVITISRQYGSGGSEIARLLCDQLGYRYFDKDLMAQLGAKLGLGPGQVVDLPEDKHQVQSLMERLFGAVPNPFGDPGEWALPAKLDAQQHLSLQTVQRLIRAAYEHDKVVLMGRGGQVVLRDAPDVLHVRVVAPIEMRIRRVQESAGVTVDAARRQVAQRDQASAEYVKRFYDVDSADPLLYHVVINTGKIAPAAAVDLIINALEGLPTAATSEAADVAA